LCQHLIQALAGQIIGNYLFELFDIDVRVSGGLRYSLA